LIGNQRYGTWIIVVQRKMAGGGFETLHEVAVTDEYDDPIGMKPLSHETDPSRDSPANALPEYPKLRTCGRNLKKTETPIVPQRCRRIESSTLGA
jgi:hypothetical protein